MKIILSLIFIFLCFTLANAQPGCVACEVLHYVRTDQLNLLEERGYNINAGAGLDATALMLAAIDKDYESLKKLIIAGADVNIKNYSGDSALIYAVKSGDLRCVELLLSEGADFSGEIGIRVMVEIYCYSNYYHLSSNYDKILVVLNGAGLFVDEEIIKARLLIKAIVENQHDIINSLLNESINVNIANSDGNTPLLALLYYNSMGTETELKLINCLIEAGADINAQNKVGYTALMLSIYRPDSTILSYLIKAGANTSIQNKDGQTALQMAIEHKNVDAINLLTSTTNQTNRNSAFTKPKKVKAR